MKRLIAFLLMSALLLTLCACGEKVENTDNATTTTLAEVVTSDNDETTTSASDATTSIDETTTTQSGATTTKKDDAVTTTSTTKKQATTTTSGKSTQVTDKQPSKTTAGSTTTTKVEEPRFPEYYELSRKTNSTATIENMFRTLYAYSEDVAGYGGGTPETENERTYAIYSFDGSANQFKHMDIYGYNITADDICGSGFGGVDIQSDLVGPSLKVDFKGVNAQIYLPLRNKSDILVCLKKDLEILEKFLGNKYGTPNISLNYGSYIWSFDDITDTMLETVANENNNTLRVTITDVKVDNKTFNMTFAFTSRINPENGKDEYCFTISIHTIR